MNIRELLFPKQINDKLIDALMQQIDEHKASLEDNIFFKSAMNVGYAYVTNVETNEIIWINDRLRNRIGNVVGKQCYEMFQNFDEPCTFCTNDELLYNGVGATKTWVHYNTMLEELLLVTDTLLEYTNGKKILYRFEISIPLTQQITKILQVCQTHKLISKP
jgi:hypothetical protein